MKRKFTSAVPRIFMTTYMAPINWEKWLATCLLSLNRSDSNIDFYDTESATIGGVLTYQF